ncbi:DMT family transporter, partial [Chamaesiphon sp. VAR_48_metabat_403]|uniref:DMT family transporter n=1 Tax=Chamaesiphon sp. VAR_48_metabat_403 TaxID=2964700 RepID=UPI00286EB121
ATQFVNGHNPISLCNVLFVGNVCALGLMMIVYRHQLTAENFGNISKVEWINLTIVAILSGALAPAAIFRALALSPVNNIILLGRLEVPLILILSRIILQERLNRYQKIGAFVVLIGIVVAVIGDRSDLSKSGLMIGTGEILTITAAVVSAIATLINKQKLSDIPVGIYGIFRTGLGSIVFFVFAVILYGSGHFAEMFSPFLWQWMLIYGGIIVVVGQSLWIKGSRESSLTVATIVSCFHPIAGMLFAYWILAELPTMLQVIGSIILLTGLLLSQIKSDRQKLTSKPSELHSSDRDGGGFEGF